MAHIEERTPGLTAPLITSETLREESREDQRQSETFRGPEFADELARSRSLSENFPEQILDFLAPLSIPAQRASARGRRNLQDVFRRTGGSKSSFAGRRFEEFERDASLNEILGQVAGAKSFFAPLAALQQNRLAVAGSPLSRSSGSGRGSSTSRSTGFGFAPPPDLRGAAALTTASSASKQAAIDRFNAPIGGGARQPSTDPLDAFGPSFFEATGRTGFARGTLPGPAPASIAPSLVSSPSPSGGGGGGNIFFDPATGLAQSTSGPNRGFNQFGDNFNLDSVLNFDQDFREGL